MEKRHSDDPLPGDDRSSVGSVVPRGGLREGALECGWCTMPIWPWSRAVVVAGIIVLHQYCWKIWVKGERG